MSGYAYWAGIWDFNPYGPVYTSTMPQTYTYVNSNTPLIVALHWQNMGKASAPLELAVSTQNATITWASNYGWGNTSTPVWGERSDGQALNETAATFHVVTNGQSPMQNKYLDVLPIGHPDSFTVTFAARGDMGFFGSLLANGTIAATYQLTNGNMYQLTS